MEYFLNITDSKCFHWQTEILIESFKANNCEDKLFVSLFEDRKTVSKDRNFLINLSSHKRKEISKNVGEMKGCEELNKIYSLVMAIASEKVTQPFLVMDPDSVLFREVSSREEDGLYPSFVFAVDPFFALDEVEKNVGPFCELLSLDKELVKSNWLPIGESYAFNKIPNSFFYNVLKDAERLAVYQILKNDKVWHRTCDLAVLANIIKNTSKIYCRGEYKLSGPIDSGMNSFVISYKNGFLPTFHKSMYAFKPPAEFSFGDPIVDLSNLTSSPNSSYVSKIARRSIAKRK